jgi:hypothetical protein
MTVAGQIDADGVVPPDVLHHGVVAVLQYGFAHFAATCSCGWTGKRHYFKAAANMDAWEHSVHEKCDVAVPLARPAAG